MATAVQERTILPKKQPQTPQRAGHVAGFNEVDSSPLTSSTSAGSTTLVTAGSGWSSLRASISSESSEGYGWTSASRSSDLSNTRAGLLLTPATPYTPIAEGQKMRPGGCSNTLASVGPIRDPTLWKSRSSDCISHRVAASILRSIDLGICTQALGNSGVTSLNKEPTSNPKTSLVKLSEKIAGEDVISQRNRNLSAGSENDFWMSENETSAVKGSGVLDIASPTDVDSGQTGKAYDADSLIQQMQCNYAAETEPPGTGDPQVLDIQSSGLHEPVLLDIPASEINVEDDQSPEHHAKLEAHCGSVTREAEIVVCKSTSEDTEGRLLSDTASSVHVPNSGEPAKSKFSYTIESKSTIPLEESDTNTRLATIVSFITRPRLKVAEALCVGSLTRDREQRCKNNARGQVGKINHYLSQLSQAVAEMECDNFLRSLEGWIDAAVCTSHGNIARDRLDFWFPQCDKLYDMQRPWDKSEVGAVNHTALTTWIKAMTTTRDNTAVETYSVKESTFSHIMTSDQARAATENKSKAMSATLVEHSVQVSSNSISSSLHWGTQTKLSFLCSWCDSLPPYHLQDFVPYLKKRRAGWTAGQVLAEALTTPLTPREIAKDGFIYIYLHPGCFGHVKIGMTGDIPERLTAWGKLCHTKVSTYFPTDPNSPYMQAVPHVYRVKALVNAELEYCRKWEIGCKGCGRNHKEWFEVQAAHAIAVVNRWIDWMRRRPYVQLAVTPKIDPSGVLWVLDQEKRVGRLKDLCKPLEEKPLSPHGRNGKRADGTRSKQRRKLA